jgi:hypothetical protein
MKNTINSPAGPFRRILPVLFCLAALTLLNFSDSRAGEFHNALSLQGFTGLLNTPNAEVTDEGSFYALYSNQRESQFPPRNAREESYLFSVGLFSFAELGGRLTDAVRPGRSNLTDLSANFKVRVPFIPKGYYLPDLAFGMQDIGGGAKNLQTKYLVATEELWRFRLSLGYGFGPDRMKGVFGGAEIKAFDWLYLVGENDTKETNVGVRLVSPEFFRIPVKLQVTAKSSLDHRPGNLEFGFGLQFPLGFDHHSTRPAPQDQGTGEGPAPAGALPAQGPLRQEPAGEPAGGAPGRAAAGMPVERSRDTDSRARLAQVMERLAAAGFQNIRVGEKGSQMLVVEYENSRFMHNELDGLGVVGAIVADTVPSGYDTLSLVMKKKDIRVLALIAPLRDFNLFLHDADTLDDFRQMLRITTDIRDDEDVDYIGGGDSRPSWLRSSLVLSPGLKTFVGTEVGVFDYLLSLKLDYYLNLWKGAVVNARWDIPTAWSENFDDGKVFSSSRANSRLERAMLFQAIKLGPDVMVNLGGGMVLHDAYGTLNEAMWTPGNGSQRFSVKQAYISGNDSQDRKTRNEVYLGAYRFYLDSLDLYLIGTGGRFFDNDKGFSVELKRLFGDTAFSVFYKNSQVPAGEHVQVGGVQVTFPLTPRREMKPYPLQVRGSDEWSYAQEVKIVSPGKANTVATSIGVNPQPAFNLEHIFYNRDRLSEMYIRKHLLRLRDAYLTYLKK